MEMEGLFLECAETELARERSWRSLFFETSLDRKLGAMLYVFYCGRRCSSGPNEPVPRFAQSMFGK